MNSKILKDTEILCQEAKKIDAELESIELRAKQNNVICEHSQVRFRCNECPKIEDIPDLQDRKNSLIITRDTNINKALKTYKTLLLSKYMSKEDKMTILVSFSNHIKDQANEFIIRLRDGLDFLRGEDHKNCLELLIEIAKNSNIDTFERSTTAVLLYNKSYLEHWVECFASIAQDKKADIRYRADACRYLFATGSEDNKTTAQECLLDIIDLQSEKSETRYSIIASFITRVGITTFFNTTKIKVPYDEKFLYALQDRFFFCDQNDIRSRILSAQHLLSMSCIGDLEKKEIKDVLFKISESSIYEENVKADAADVLLRLGVKEERLMAAKIIQDIGRAGINIKNKDLLARIMTIYNNSQNIHDETISSYISHFIEKMCKDMAFHQTQDDTYKNVVKEVSAMIAEKNLDPKSKFLINRSLHRIELDTATFTTYQVSIATIFSFVWKKIQTFPKERIMLCDRLIQELIDMGDTCSSGHVGRFVNVLSGVDGDITISFEEQINANVAGRLNAKIRDTKDEKKRTSITNGMLEDADPEDIKIYAEFITDTQKELYKTLYEEFVGENYLSQEEFEKYFERGIKPWLPKSNTS